MKANTDFEARVIQSSDKIRDLVISKNRAYGDSINAGIGLIRGLYPNGVRPEQYEDFLVVVRVLDKLSRIARGDGTGGEDAWADLTGYGLLRMAQTIDGGER